MSVLIGFVAGFVAALIMVGVWIFWEVRSDERAGPMTSDELAEFRNYWRQHTPGRELKAVE